MIEDEKEIFIIVRDGESECGLSVLVIAGRVRKIVPDATATDHVAGAAVLISGLLKSGMDFDAILALAPDSPRVGDVVEQIRDRLVAASDNEPAQSPATQGESDEQRQHTAGSGA